MGFLEVENGARLVIESGGVVVTDGEPVTPPFGAAHWWEAETDLATSLLDRIGSANGVSVGTGAALSYAGTGWGGSLPEIVLPANRAIRTLAGAIASGTGKPWSMLIAYRSFPVTANQTLCGFASSAADQPLHIAWNATANNLALGRRRTGGGAISNAAIGASTTSRHLLLVSYDGADMRAMYDSTTLIGPTANVDNPLDVGRFTINGLDRSSGLVNASGLNLRFAALWNTNLDPTTQMANAYNWGLARAPIA